MKSLFQFLFITICFCNSLYSQDFILESMREAEILSESTQQPILVIFGSEDCVYCQQLKDDILKGTFSEQMSAYIICYIDIDNHIEYKRIYRVKTIPDSRIIYNNKEKSRTIGYSKKKFSEWLDSLK